MSSEIESLRKLLLAGEIEKFLDHVSVVADRVRGRIEFTCLTQGALPPLLRVWLARSSTPSRSIVQLWDLVRREILLVVENDILTALNGRIDAAWHTVHGRNAASPGKLRLFADKGEIYRRVSLAGKTIVGEGNQRNLYTRKIVVQSKFSLSFVALGELTDARRNVCASHQEREFIKAVRQFVPNAWAYPNVPIRNFIDVARIMPKLSRRQLQYSRLAEVDILLCTHDEDPIAGFELDSALHDTDSSKERDRLKNEIFALAGIPLLRIRADDTTHVRAEDFYELLMAERESIEKLRPSRFRACRTHDVLVPV